MANQRAASAGGKAAKPATQPAAVIPAPAPAPAAMPTASFKLFRKCDWLAAAAAFAIAMTGYVWTMAPNVTLEDSGELITGAHHLGVPHPPGYPIWTVLGFLFDHLNPLSPHPVPDYVKADGVNITRRDFNIAWRVTLMSATFSALASGLLALLISRSGSMLLRSVKLFHESLTDEQEKWIAAVCGTVGALVFAYSPVPWSQAVVGEVYTLNALFMALTMVTMFIWMHDPQRDRYLYWTGFLWALGLTNHQTLLFMAPAFFIMIAMVSVPVLMDGLVGACWVIAVGMWFMEWVLDDSTFILTSTYFWGGAAAAVAPAPIWLASELLSRLLGWPTRINWKRAAILAACVLGGLLFYGYSPLASSTNPPMNWGFTQNKDGFWHHITRGQYEKVKVDRPWPVFWNQMKVFFDGLRTEYSGMFVAIGAAALAWFFHSDKEEKERWKKIFTNPYWLALPIGLLIVCLPAAYWIGMAWTGLLYAVCMLVLGSIFLLYNCRPAMKWKAFTAWGIFFTSVTFIVLANPTLDRAVLFNDRVFFMLTHALFCAWIGYGLIWGLAFASLHFEKLRWLLYGAALMACMLQLGYQIVYHQTSQTATEMEWFWVGAQIAILFGLSIVVFLANDNKLPMMRILVLVACLPVVGMFRNWRENEMRGHMFGWYFGYHMFEPGGGYPRMDKDAILYGGTDPGRFVPTYEIFCPRVHPDVYIITQNALAENTYLRYLRYQYNNVRKCSPALQGRDLKNQPAFIAKLQRPTDGVSAFFRQQFSPELRQDLDQLTPENFLPEDSPRSYGFAANEFRGRFSSATLVAAITARGISVVEPSSDIKSSNKLFAESTAASAPRGASQPDIEALNKLLVESSLHSKFPGLVLRKEAKDLAEHEAMLTSEDRIKLNRLVLEAAFPQECPKKDLLKRLLGEMNQRLLGQWLYDPQRFAGVAFSDEARALLRAGPQRSGVSYANRRLIEAAYAGEVGTIEDRFNVLEKLLGRHTVYPREDMYISTDEDSAIAIRSYVEELQHRPAMPGEQVQIVGGRVNIQGVQAVTALNGLVSKQIFDRERDKHTFYVEESFVIQWMYNYLEPYGIIMKINRDPLPKITPEMVALNRKYWTEYIQKYLADDPRFRRDDDAQRAFSKLRTAHAGLYAWRVTMAPPEQRQPELAPEADLAFRQALDLCPFNVEATFRFAEFLTRTERYDEALKLVDSYKKYDPHNIQVGVVLNQIGALKQLSEQESNLRRALQTNPRDLNLILQLLSTLAQRGKFGEMDVMIDQLIENKDLPPQPFKTIAQTYVQMNRLDRVERVLSKYLGFHGDDAQAWYDFAVVEVQLQRADRAVEALEKSLRLFGNNPITIETAGPDGKPARLTGTAKQVIQQDPRLTLIRLFPRFQELMR